MSFVEAALLQFQYPETRCILLFVSSFLAPLLSLIFLDSFFLPFTLAYSLLALAAARFSAGGNFRGSVEAGHSRTLTGKICIITGAATGTGRQNVIDFAQRGATVIFAARGKERCARVIKEIKAVLGSSSADAAIHHIDLDLASFASIRAAVKEFKTRFDRLDFLINNAGVMMCPYGLTEDGLEMQMGTNHFGHFLLTSLLEDYIRSSKGRVVNLASSMHHAAYFGVDYDKFSQQKYYDPSKVYGQSKMMNVLHAFELNKRLAGSGATAYSVHPGFVSTELTRHLLKGGIANLFWPIFTYFCAKNPEQGAKPALYCALSSSAVAGRYHADCGVVQCSALGLSDSIAEQLWRKSEEIIKRVDKS